MRLTGAWAYIRGKRQAVNAVPMVSVAATTGLLNRIVVAGGDPDEILRVAGLNRLLLAKADGFIASASFAGVLREAARGTGDDCFGLHFGEHFEPRDIGALVYVFLNSPTIADAIENVVRYVHIHNRGATVRFSVEEGLGYLRYLLGDCNAELWRQQNEFSMTVAFKSFRIMIGADWTPHRIEFAHGTPADISEHARVFGCGVKFGCAWNAIVLQTDLLDRRVTVADMRLYRILKQHVERVLSEIPRDDDLLASARGAIAQCMGEGTLNLACVARKLAMSPRSLERRLHEHGAIFRTTADEMRQRLALEYLSSDRHTLCHIAFLLGYSEVSAFNRAFKRWTGVSPLQYRTSKRAARQSRS